jgi:hypothetical protein
MKKTLLSLTLLVGLLSADLSARSYRGGGGDLEMTAPPAVTISVTKAAGIAPRAGDTDIELTLHERVLRLEEKIMMLETKLKAIESELNMEEGNEEEAGMEE